MASPTPTASTLDLGPQSSQLNDRRALQILAKTIYRELREAGLGEEDVMCVAGELLSHVTASVKDRRR